MSEVITLTISEALARQAREIAALTQRSLEDILIEWLDRSAADLPVNSLSDERILQLCDAEMDATQQRQLGDLLDRNREGILQPPEDKQLDELMQVYRRGLIWKAQALKAAVDRGLRSPLNEPLQRNC